MEIHREISEGDLANTREVLASLVGREGVDPKDIVEALSVINKDTEINALEPEKVFNTRKLILDGITAKNFPLEVGGKLTSSLIQLQEKVNEHYWESSRKESKIVGSFVAALGTVVLAPSVLALSYTLENAFKHFQQKGDISSPDIALSGLFAVLTAMGGYMVALAVNQIRNTDKQKKFY